ncbi:MAG: MerR family transcriptional regulator [Prevotella sp. AG:487_50_53]|nr:MAG: MerR family transcriptional regulator [Prevotella sp. AG:487_50_53]
MIEKTPVLSLKDKQEAVRLFFENDITPLLKRISNEYCYWDKVKYLAPEGISAKTLWQLVKMQRTANAKSVRFGNYIFRFTITEHMLSQLHELDMSMGGNLGTGNLIPESDKSFYLVSSIMEESIASSQMEGASTTRKVAKEMLLKNQKPKDKSQQMIANNYETIKYLSENRQDSFSMEKLLTIHRYISSGTLENHDDEGCLRKSDDIVVMDGITGEIAHTPPPHDEIETLLRELCQFADNDDPDSFIHPIVKGIIIHFMLAFIHPFVDGNGRTARSLVYWYLMKKGYWLTEYLSISRIIYRNKKQYEKAFLYTEADEYDLSYFIQFNLMTMKKAYEELKAYLQRKIAERNNLTGLRGIKGINLRQAHIISNLYKDSGSIITAKEIAMQFAVTDRTARTDLQSLVRLGLMSEVPLNNRMTGYVQSDNFESVIKELKNGK